MAKKVVKKLEKKQSGGSEDKYAYKKSVFFLQITKNTFKTNTFKQH